MAKRKGYVTAASAHRQALRAYVLGLAAGGVTMKSMCHRTGLHRTTISRLLQRVKATRSLADAPRTGRPSIISAVMKRRVSRLLLDEDYGSAPRVAAALRKQRIDIGPTTVRKIAKELSIRSYVRREKWEATPVDRAARLAFATSHISDSEAQRRLVVYLDEKLFICNLKTRRVWVQNARSPHVVPPGTSRKCLLPPSFNRAHSHDLIYPMVKRHCLTSFRPVDVLVRR